MSEWVRQSRICHYVLLASAFLSPPVTMRATENSLSISHSGDDTHVPKMSVDYAGIRHFWILFFSNRNSFCASWCKVCLFDTPRNINQAPNQMPHCQKLYAIVGSAQSRRHCRRVIMRQCRDTQVALVQYITLILEVWPSSTNPGFGNIFTNNFQRMSN